jgi:hypothetical protein
MARIVNFPTGQVSDSVGAALGTVMAEYDRRRDTVALAFQLANLSDERLAASLAEATPGEVSSLKWFLQADAVAFFGLAELLSDAMDRVEAMRRNLI